MYLLLRSNKIQSVNKAGYFVCSCAENKSHYPKATLPFPRPTAAQREAHTKLNSVMLAANLHIIIHMYRLAELDLHSFESEE
jgi:hypothetical protein